MSHHEESHHHIVPIPTLGKVFVALLVLMILTVWWANASYSILPDAPWASFVNNGVAMTIAVIKATMVIQIFMGVKYASSLTKMYAIMGFVWVTLLMIAFCDWGTRWLEPTKGWEGKEVLPQTGMIKPQVDPAAVAKAKVEGEGGGH